MAIPDNVAAAGALAMEHDEYLLPPGCKDSILQHPSGSNEAVELALFQDHRFAFFFWSRWTRKLGLEKRPPTLVSLDWHEDLAAPGGEELDELIGLNQGDPREVSLFCWERLNPINDGHILAAAYLNLIGDIYVVRKQIESSDNSFEDSQGRSHRICCFGTIEELLVELKQAQGERVFFDLDLDYFTESPDLCGGGGEVQLVSDDAVRSVLDPKGELLGWVFERFAGMTIATEPEFCGGVINSNRLLSVVSDCLFYPQLMGHGATWKHLR